MSTVIYPAPIFGPVRSRRLGVSLGVNLLPADGKLCSFDCIYCECGLNAERRPSLGMTPRPEVAEALEERLSEMRRAGEPLDAITFAGNGEPTMHPQFEGIIDDARGIRDAWYPEAKICVLTNSTRITRENVRRALMKADRPCLKLDTVDPAYIRKVDRPNSRYDIDEILRSMRAFAGKCIIQSMFLEGEWYGIPVGNTGDEYVLPWLEAVKSIRPVGVDIYTIARDTPGEGLRKAGPTELDRIAALVAAAGIDAHAYY